MFRIPWRTIIALLISYTSIGICSQIRQTEEPHFTQSIVHPVVTEETAFDPLPFKPYIVKVTPPPNVIIDSDCQCGVHDFIDDAKKNHQKSSNQGTTKNDNDVNYLPFVVPGTITHKNQFPFVVALIYRQANGSATHFCGGSLISSKLVLTATHCLQGRVADKTEVWLNERDLLLTTETDHPTIKLRTVKFLPHPEYNPLMNYNDISLLELSEPVNISASHLRPICLPSELEPTEYDGVGFTAGWGKVNFNGPKSDRLLHVDVPLISNKACNEESQPYYNGRVTTHMVCAGDLVKGGRDACPGDSGGPLFIKDNDRFKLIGIVSWGERCSEPRRPGVYTRVSKYLRWIKSVEAKTLGSVQCSDPLKKSSRS